MVDRVSIEITGLDIVRKGMQQIQRNGKNTKPAMGAIGKYGKQLTELNFELQRSPEGRPWKPLELDTKRRRIQAGHIPLTILTASGTLRKSIQPKVRGNTVTISTGRNVEYARTMQDGLPSKNIPARPYLGFAEKHQRHMVAFMEEFSVNNTPWQRIVGGVANIARRLLRLT